jgi:thiamine monophosphate synthase
MKPTQEHISGFLQGLMEAERIADKALMSARMRKLSASSTVRQALRRGVRDYQLRAENHGYQTMPKIDQVVTCCAISGAVIAALFVFFS